MRTWTTAYSGSSTSTVGYSRASGSLDRTLNAAAIFNRTLSNVAWMADTTGSTRATDRGTVALAIDAAAWALEYSANKRLSLTLESVSHLMIVEIAIEDGTSFAANWTIRDVTRGGELDDSEK